MLFLECESVFTRFCKAVVPVCLTQFNVSDDPDIVPQNPGIYDSMVFFISCAMLTLVLALGFFSISASRICSMSDAFGYFECLGRNTVNWWINTMSS